MLTFFRRLRKSFIITGATQKYLLYAIGEIALVVIGILIALQINNWNEFKKNKQFEKETLQQIRANLIKDRLSLLEIQNVFIKAVNSTDKILQSDNHTEISDSIAHWMGDIVQFERFRPLTNAYEVIKSKGLDLIRDKLLRFKLGAYYDDQIQQVSGSIEDIEHAFKIDWLPIMKKEAKEFQFKRLVELKDKSALFKDTELRAVLVLNRDNYKGAIENNSEVIDVIIELENLITKNLKNG